jgi:hypothetical protein
VSEDNNIENNTQETSIDVVINEYETRIANLKADYESKIAEMQNRHIQEIRTLMKTGTSPQAEEIKQEDLSEEDQLLESLRNKFKLN